MIKTEIKDVRTSFIHEGDMIVTSQKLDKRYKLLGITIFHKYTDYTDDVSNAKPANSPGFKK